ncbi:hypothetical protein AB0B89_35410 [Sphaerisporangium sp. NPDC049002]|uniref:hypothetical protein n=1 Tax=Sphaerisporangium sp. NPDC049002 TaxID=3155392 RepID=UPI0033DA0F32
MPKVTRRGGGSALPYKRDLLRLAPLPGPGIEMSGAGTGPLGIEGGKLYARHVPEASTYPCWPAELRATT